MYELAHKTTDIPKNLLRFYFTFVRCQNFRKRKERGIAVLGMPVHAKGWCDFSLCQTEVCIIKLR